MKDEFINAFMATIEELIDEKVREKLRELEVELERGEIPKGKCNPDEYLSIQQLSEHTGLCKATIYAMRSRREIPAYKFGRELRFKRSEIEQWIASRRQTTFNFRTVPNGSVAISSCGGQITKNGRG